MTGAKKAPVIATVEELLARARAMENEAADRYEDFAAQMDQHNNKELAALFLKLAEFERRHGDEIGESFAGMSVASAPAAPLARNRSEGIETPPVESLHYLMTPYHALLIALQAEENAERFFSTLARNTASADVRNLARKFAADEKEHVRMVREWLARVPKPADDWAYDPDEPRMPE